jgi:hypothetical protein
MKSWIKKHWKTVASVGCGVASVVLAPISAPAALGVMGVCSLLGLSAGKSYEAGKAIGGLVKPAIEKLRK